MCTKRCLELNVFFNHLDLESLFSSSAASLNMVHKWSFWWNPQDLPIGLSPVGAAQLIPSGRIRGLRLLPLNNVREGCLLSSSACPLEWGPLHTRLNSPPPPAGPSKGLKGLAPGPAPRGVGWSPPFPPPLSSHSGSSLLLSLTCVCVCARACVALSSCFNYFS